MLATQSLPCAGDSSRASSASEGTLAPASPQSAMAPLTCDVLPPPAEHTTSSGSVPWPDADIGRKKGHSKYYICARRILERFKRKLSDTATPGPPPLLFEGAAKQQSGGHKKCEVCNKPATGRHYGAYTCFGCKSFWHRSIDSKREFECRLKGNCVISRVQSRNICRACRLRRCELIGMNPLEIRSNYRSPLTISSGSSNKKPSYFDRRLVNRAISMLKHHNRILAYIDDSREASQIECLSYRYIPFEDAFKEPSLVSKRTRIALPNNRPGSASDVLQSYRRTFVAFTDWLKSLPDYGELSDQDQVALAQRKFSVFHWWLTGMWAATHQTPTIFYTNGCHYQPDQASSSNSADLFVETMLSAFILPFWKADFDPVERVMVFALALFENDNMTLSMEGQAKVTALHSELASCLFHYELEKYQPGSDCSSIAFSAFSTDSHFVAVQRMASIESFSVKLISLCSIHPSSTSGVLVCGDSRS